MEKFKHFVGCINGNLYSETHALSDESNEVAIHQIQHNANNNLMANAQNRNHNPKGKSIDNNEEKAPLKESVEKEHKIKTSGITRKKRQNKVNMIGKVRNEVKIKRRKIWRKVLNLRRLNRKQEGKKQKLKKLRKKKARKLKEKRLREMGKKNRNENCTISGLLDNTKLYRKYNNQQRQIIRMLGKSSKAASKANKSTTTFQRLLKAIKNVSAVNTSCPGCPASRKLGLRYEVLEECNVTAFGICSEAVLSNSNVSNAENCLTKFKSFIKDYDVSIISLI